MFIGKREPTRSYRLQLFSSFFVICRTDDTVIYSLFTMALMALESFRWFVEIESVQPQPNAAWFHASCIVIDDDRARTSFSHTQNSCMSPVYRSRLHNMFPSVMVWILRHIVFFFRYHNSRSAFIVGDTTVSQCKQNFIFSLAAPCYG